MKVITLITSSNKHGNSKKIVDRLTIGIEDAGGSNEVLFMDDYNILLVEVVKMVEAVF